MGRRKEFRSAAKHKVSPAQIRTFIEGATIRLPDNALGRRTVNFGPHLGRGFDSVVKTCMTVMDEALRSKVKSPASIAIYGKQGLPRFFEFLAQRCKRTKSQIELQHIDRTLLNEYIGYLSRDERLSYTTQKNLFTQLKSVLVVPSQRELLAPPHELFPENPYPNSNRRRQKGAKPLTEAERRSAVAALKKDLIAIYNGRFDRPMSEAIAVCFVAVSLRSGRSTTPLIEVLVGSVKDHPFRSNLRLLKTVKRRGNNVGTTPLRKGHIDDGAVQADAVAMIELVLRITHDLRTEAPKQLRDRLWLYRSEDQATLGKVMALTPGLVTKLCRNIAARHGLTRSDGSPLPIHPAALRKTYIGRMWHLSGGDPFAVSRIAGNTVKVLDQNYLEVTPEMERDHAFLGEALVEGWRGQSEGSPEVPKPVNTPVGRCKDPINGDKAPKNGKPCIDFSSCFRCRSYVITEEETDLHRLFSYYWFLVSERARIGSAKWAKHFGWIVRMIDDQVTAKFDADKIKRIRAYAKESPHPFWRSPLTREAARGA